ncbi:MAG: hypothetical protein LBN22_08820, partial [Clostridiales Family XIII bacterium]|nr:hypothetical protein [Clostridiales Family XIII bacterium]
MINVRNAHTDTLSNAHVAVEEILSQLKLDIYSRTNAIAIISCNSEFIDNGFVDLLSQALPCELVGITTVASSTAVGMGIFSCSVSVLLSDDVTFVTAYSDSINTDNMDRVIDATYKNASADYREKPAMILTYAPFIFTVDCARSE